MKENELSRNEKVRDYIKYKTRLSSDYEKLADKTELVMDSNEFVLRIKRSGSLSLQIAYKIGSQAGDCNFDQSICNYTSNLLSDSAISSSLNKQTGQIIRHLPKYTSYSINDKDVLKKSKDFYLSLSKSVDNNDAVFSPLVQVDKKIDRLINRVMELMRVLLLIGAKRKRSTRFYIQQMGLLGLV